MKKRKVVKGLVYTKNLLRWRGKPHKITFRAIFALKTPKTACKSLFLLHTMTQKPASATGC
jgi:hypothetical protein